MPTAVWTGSLSLGLVVVPVRLYPAVKKKTVRFHELDRGGRRVRHVRVSEPAVEEFEIPDYASAMKLPGGVRRENVELPLPTYEARSSEQVVYEEIRKGYEVAPGQYVSMTREEVAALAPERNRVIDVEQFVDVSAVDPIYFESRYYVVPDREWSSPFRVLRQASHITLTNGERQVTIPCRNPLKALTMGGIARDAGLTVEQFRKLL